jgi:hypothetical protein
MYSNMVQKYAPLPPPTEDEEEEVDADERRCFDDCINDFTSKAVSSKEETCIGRCVQKFVKTSERLGTRFGEANAAMMQSQMGGK